MNRSDIVTKLEAVEDKSALNMVNIFLTIVEECLARGEEVKIANFGKFVVRSREAVERRNPRTGETIQVPAKNAVLFKPSPALRRKINR